MTEEIDKTEQLKEFYKKIGLIDKKIKKREEIIAQIEEAMKPYLDKIKEEKAKIKQLEQEQITLENEAHQKGMLTFELGDFLNSFGKLKEITLADISTYIKIKGFSYKNESAKSELNLLSEAIKSLEEDTREKCIQLVVRAKKSVAEDFFYAITFPFDINTKFSNGTTLKDNLVTVKDQNGNFELQVKDASTLNIILNIHPYETIKQKPWTCLREDEIFHKAVINSSIKHYKRQKPNNFEEEKTK